MSSNSKCKNKPLAADISIGMKIKQSRWRFQKLVQCLQVNELEGGRTWGSIGTLEGTLFLTFIFNEPTLFHTVAICAAASIVRQRYIALECESHSTSCTNTSLSVADLSHSHQQATRRATQLTVATSRFFWTFGDASRNSFPPFIIRLFEAMSHGWAARGACRLWWDLLMCCNVGMLSWLWLMLVHFVVWFQNQSQLQFYGQLPVLNWLAANIFIAQYRV